ncbi:simple sugar transport system permease protein [Paenibacillus sp. DS2015]|uniref:ABC transporter permease n=1 Tax=Paenibacillus sp. DS2015 TaxID=3373917 RepID=UPI003D233228
MDFIMNLLVVAISAGTPLLFAALGGILCERSGVVNLGTEGIMLMGAVSACLTYIHSGSFILAVLAAIGSGCLLGLLHSFLSITLKANQNVSGLGITLFGTGLSAYLGKPAAGTPIPGSVPKVNLPWLDGVPILGNLFAHLDILIWFSFLLVIMLHFYMNKTSWGLHLRSVGDSPATADAMGLRVYMIRYAHVVAGSALMGLAGAYLLLAYSPSWIENMTAGRGWIAIALIIFARWSPGRALICAYMFGAMDAIGFRLQIIGSEIPSYFLKMIPYVLTIIVLMFFGWRSRHQLSNQPQSLGVPYIREQRL